MIFDSHAHPHFGDYAADRDDILNKCLQHNIGVIAVGVNLQDSRLAVELAGRFSQVWASVGLHPSSVFDETFNLVKFRNLFTNRVVAVGETGLDYWHTEEANITFTEWQQRQVVIFKKHIGLARQKNLPLILHIRNGKEERLKTAYTDCLAILKRHRFNRGVVHSWGGTVAEVLAFIKAGFYIGFTANITYPKAADLVEAAVAVPLDRILTETDSPFLPPQHIRGQRNDPTQVVEVIKKIAAIKNLSYEQVAQVTASNTQKLFNLTV